MSPRSRLTLLSGLVVASCATATPGTRLLPPPELLQDCQEPALRLQTNGQLAEAVAALRATVQGCNRDKAALRDWAR